MNTSLKGKVALVTGGSRGIGAATALLLAEQGADVAISYVASADKADAVVSDIKAKGVRAIAIRADQADSAQMEKLVRTVADQLGGLDILVNNAGIVARGIVGEAVNNNAELDRLNTVNYTGVVTAIREAAKIMGDGGRIVTIGSVVAARAGFDGMADYAASKAAVVGYTKGAARDLAKRNITVNVVQPGPIDTDMNADAGDFKPVLLATVPQGRFGTAEEVAAGVAFLASPAASYITGTVLNIDGGYGA